MWRPLIPVITIESMFEVLVLETREVDDASLIDSMTSATRTEAQNAARRLAAIAELTHRRCIDHEDRDLWACDGWDAAASEIGAALTINRWQAASHMHLALTLRDRLPKVGALLAAGDLSLALVTLICWHTELVHDPATLALIDTAMAGAAREWGPLSKADTIRQIDHWIQKFDPAAVRRTRNAVRGRDVEFGKPGDPAGVTSVWALLLATDAALLERTLTAMAHEVCDDDPRTLGQRRADALGVLAARGDRLPCHCTNPDCPAAGADPRAATVIIHVLTDAAPHPVSDPLLDTPDATPPITTHTAVAEALAPTPEPAPAVDQSAVGYLPSGTVIPAVLLADLAARGATVKTVITPQVPADGQPHYRPSTALDRYVRMRDLTCMHPGCDHPAADADLDHTIAWPAGPTHPGNLTPKCRKHHLVKTFYTGTTGWHTHQNPDGTIAWTAPTGHTYTTVPGSRILFPDKHFPTGPPPPPTAATTSDQPGRDLMMPTRRRTRTDARTRHTRHERALNWTELLESAPTPEAKRQLAQQLINGDSSPPF
ncbi:hypothetical protein MAUB_34930 [Mycolicibacterium aubagnense]|uniref:DUF222 domain-containing protein n=3 Tax=Mycolicibacterium aubagnense TaxID=319707 RepID=A0ABM7IFS3_9MYCO|nr:hypothetical protein MAUB_34930 [Mycolicibacterium aubagnense]